MTTQNDNISISVAYEEKTENGCTGKSIRIDEDEKTKVTRLFVRKGDSFLSIEVDDLFLMEEILTKIRSPLYERISSLSTIDVKEMHRYF